jgi:hypothetical protein
LEHVAGFQNPNQNAGFGIAANGVLGRRPHYNHERETQYLWITEGHQMPALKKEMLSLIGLT